MDGVRYLPRRSFFCPPSCPSSPPSSLLPWQRRVVGEAEETAMKAPFRGQSNCPRRSHTIRRWSHTDERACWWAVRENCSTWKNRTQNLYGPELTTETETSLLANRSIERNVHPGAQVPLFLAIVLILLPGNRVLNPVPGSIRVFCPFSFPVCQLSEILSELTVNWRFCSSKSGGLLVVVG